MNKKNLILGGVLLFLIIAAYVYQKPLKEWQISMSEKKNFFANLDVEKIKKIEINKEGKTFILEKEGDRLKVSGTKDFYVNDGTAKVVLDNLKEASSAEFEMVSSNKENKGEFMTDESGAAVKIYVGEGEKEAVSFIVGKNSSDYVGTYVSRNDMDETYMVKAGLTVFNQGEWRDSSIFKTDIDKISKIRFQYQNREFTVEKKDGKWTGVSPYKFSVSEEKIKKVADIMSALNAVSIPDQNFEGAGLEKNNIIIQATGEGIDNTLIVGDENEEGYYYALKIGSDNIYLISKSLRDELEKKISDLR